MLEPDRQSVVIYRPIQSRSRRSEPRETRVNYELKAVDVDPARTRATCAAIGASFHGVIHQRDTYFDAVRGGLKLRDEEPGSPHLIQFERATTNAERPSRYRIIAVDDASELAAALAVAVGISAVVTKRRALYLWRNVRIHLDDVDSLGRFIELEAVAKAGADLADERQLVARLRRAFHIEDEHLVELAYAQQLADLAGSDF